MHRWDRTAAVAFALVTCGIGWTLSFAQMFGPAYTINFRGLGLTADARDLEGLAASFLPAMYCLFIYPECRSALWKFEASWRVYFACLITGLCLPFGSYFGGHNPAFPWGRRTAIDLVMLFTQSLVWVCLWEEILWRGCFQKKIRPFLSAPMAIICTSVSWTAWHAVKILFLYRGGVPIGALEVQVCIYFLLGILLGSVFELGNESIWPAVLLHSGLDAAITAYYSDFGRAFEIGSYVANLVFTMIITGFFASGRNSEKSAGYVRRRSEIWYEQYQQQTLTNFMKYQGLSGFEPHGV